AATLEQLLARHGAELSEGERQALEAAITELKGLVASISLRVVPETARVLLDGRALAASEWAAPLVLNVGEHTLSADAPGYTAERRVLRIAGGQREVPVSIELRCASGFVEVTSNDPTAYIAIDGIPKARRAYRGPVEPDTDHLLQVYREGIETFEQTFQVGVCKTLGIKAELEGAGTTAPSDTNDAEAPLPGAPPKRSQRGFFGLLSLDLLALTKQPLAPNVSTPSSSGGFGALGLRAGYRISTPVAFALRLDVGALSVEGARETATSKARDYALTAIHFGPDLKLMTTGDKLRFVATVGAGVVHHRLSVSKGIPDEVRGIDPYFSLELSLGFNYRQFLGEIGLIASIDGSTGLQKGFSDSANKDLTKDLGTTLPMLGIGLRGGFSQWRSFR
ncbi:MAG TPA: hypothetical protein VEQ59_21705, partial [Polyangiaceae bacterium]|nr:hypothetical protein [Polyangiaceae bacterium]